MSIGVAAFAVVFLFAALFGFLDRTANEKSLATDKPPTQGNPAIATVPARDSWIDDLWGTDQTTAALSVTLHRH